MVEEGKSKQLKPIGYAESASTNPLSKFFVAAVRIHTRVSCFGDVIITIDHSRITGHEGSDIFTTIIISIAIIIYF